MCKGKQDRPATPHTTLLALLVRDEYAQESTFLSSMMCVGPMVMQDCLPDPVDLRGLAGNVEMHLTVVQASVPPVPTNVAIGHGAQHQDQHAEMLIMDPGLFEFGPIVRV